MKISLSSNENSGINICSDRNLSELEYAGDVVPFIDDIIGLQVLLDGRNNNVAMFGMRYASLTCKILLQHSIGWKPIWSVDDMAKP